MGVIVLFAVFFAVLFMLAAWIQGGRAERIEEAMEYDPEPIHGQARFCTPDELRKKGW